MDRKVKKKRSWVEKWRSKYRLVFITDDTLEERFTFRLSRMNVFIALGTLIIVLIFLTSILIAFTPLREYIPGYTNIGLTRKLYHIQARTDSIERVLEARELFIQNMRDVISGNELPGQQPVVKDSMRRYSNIKLKRSEEDSLLRLEVENQSKYSINKIGQSEALKVKKASIGTLLFFSPVKGVITSSFDVSKRHFGVDVVAKANETVKSVLDGTVITTDWTLETGYMITVQHAGNIISVYKHNAANLKQSGDFVRAGEPIAVIGDTGEFTTGPHLHFELWSEGMAVDPRLYITF